MSLNVRTNKTVAGGVRQKKLPAVFLDRDGTINREVDYLRRVEDLRILPGAARAIAALNRAGYLIVVLTNQAAIARGLLSEPGLDKIHKALIERLLRRGARLDAIYYCPHHPKAFVKKYRMQCPCRKPNIGMIKEAMKHFPIDMGRSFMVGDKESDIGTGRRARLRTILVRTGYGKEEEARGLTADFIVNDLMAAAHVILKNKTSITKSRQGKSKHGKPEHGKRTRRKK